MALALYSGQRDARSAPNSKSRQRRGDLAIRNAIRDQDGSLAFDLSIKQPPIAQWALDTPAGH
jgi:hypothetical protein